MKKKGFTLIELLAVIVILAVIALIATPAVLNIIEDSKKAAAEASARNIASSAKAYYMQNLMYNITTGTVDLSKNIFPYDGDKASKGYLSYDANGNAYGKMYVNNYCIEIKSDGTIISTKTNESDCDTTKKSNVTSNGTVVYYNPVTNTKCTSDEANNNTSLNSGCMKWYVFLDTEESTKYKILLNHNTSNDLVAWNANKILSAGPVTATAKLNTDTKDWNTSIKSSIRLITASEVSSITSSTNWTNKSSAIQIYDANNISYVWLFDNVKDYYGYWTSTSVLDSDSDYTGSAWGVYVNDSKGYLTGADTIDETRIYGVRPVIEVDKSILK